MGNGNNISHNHHYVPQFHQKYFANNNGIIYAYNKLKNKSFTPRTKDIFADENRNTFINADGNKSDTIEKIYSGLESKCNEALRKFTETKIFNKDCKNILLFFAYLSKWRSPEYDPSYEDAKQLTFEDLRLHLGNVELGIDYNLDELWQDEERQEFKRILLSIQPFIYKEDYKDIVKNTFILETPEPFNAILGSCPFLENSFTPNIFESFLFPLTPKYTLIYLNHCNIKDWTKFYIENISIMLPLINNLRDLSIYHASRDILISNTPERLKFISDKYNLIAKSKLDPRTLQSLLFQTMIESYKDKNILEKIRDIFNSNN